MDKKLQKLILEIIKSSNGAAKWQHVFNKTVNKYWERDKQPIEASTIIKHELYLLEKEDKLIRKEQLPDIFYILTPSGHHEFDSRLKKIWRFILYDKNNLFVLVSLSISLAALVISILYK